MNKKIYYWKLRDSEIQLGERTLIMGVLNITPDSFSDGGHFNDPEKAYARALELEEQGADIIDIGAESTRPGSTRISADEEWQRLVPVLKKLRDAVRIPLSLDTYKSEIAERALQYGVQIFNDPSGLTFDPGLAKVAANGNAGLILNHMRGQPETWGKLPPMADPLGTIGNELAATVSRARMAGVERNRIVVDPGLGFGKRKEQNSEILGKLKKLAAQLDLPILVGASRKSFLSQATEADTSFATAAAVAIAAFNGAHIVRVHDVKQMQSVLLVADEIAKNSVEPEVEAEAPAAPKARSARVRMDAEGAERVRPTRPPLAKPVVVAAPVDAAPIDVQSLDAQPIDAEPIEATLAPASEEAGEGVEAEVETETAAAAPEAAVEKPGFKKPLFEKKPYEKKPFEKKPYEKRPFGSSESRPPRREGGWDAPPKREFRHDGPPPPRREGAPPRDRDWRPGAGAPPKRDFRPGGRPPRRDDGPPRGDRPSYDRPSGPPRGDRPSYDRPSYDRPNYDRPRGDRPSGPPRGDRPSYDRPSGDRPNYDRPRGDRPSGPPRGDRPSFDRPRGDRPSGPPRGDRPSFDRPRGDRPSGPPRGDRPGFDRPRGDRPSGPPRGDGPPRRPPFRKRP